MYAKLNKTIRFSYKSIKIKYIRQEKNTTANPFQDSAERIQESFFQNKELFYAFVILASDHQRLRISNKSKML